MENSKIAIGSLPTLQTSHGLLALFEKIYDGGPILTIFSNIGDDVYIIPVLYAAQATGVVNSELAPARLLFQKV